MEAIINNRRQIFPPKIFALNINEAYEKDFAETKFDSTLVSDIPNYIQVLEKKEIPPKKYILYSKFFPYGTLEINRIKVQTKDSVTFTNPSDYFTTTKPVVTIVFINNIQLNQLKFDNNPAQPTHIHYVISEALNNSKGIVITFKFKLDEFNAGAIKDTPEEIDKMIKLLYEYDNSDEGYTKMGMRSSDTRHDIDLAAQEHNMPEPVSPRSPSRPLSPRGGKNSTRRRRRTSTRRRRNSTRRRKLKARKLRNHSN